MEYLPSGPLADPQVSLNLFQRIKITYIYIFPDYKIKLESQKDGWKISECLEIKHILLYNTCAKDEITMEQISAK